MLIKVITNPPPQQIDLDRLTALGTPPPVVAQIAKLFGSPTK